MSGAAVIVALRVAATPARAFEVFTRDIGSWWQSHPLFELARGDDGVPRFDPAGPGGRLVMVQVGDWHLLFWVSAAVALVVLAGIVLLVPHVHDAHPARFDAVGAETRVTVEHRGWDQIPQSHAARHGFDLMLFQRRLGEHWRGLLAAMGRRL